MKSVVTIFLHRHDLSSMFPQIAIKMTEKIAICVLTYFIALTIDSPIWTQSTAWSGLSRGAPLMQ
jgi:hypothetical protein